MSKKLRKIKTGFLLLFYKYFKPWVQCNCGHISPRMKKVLCFNEEIIMSTSGSGKDDPEYCPDCLANMTIRCANPICGSIITVGSPIITRFTNLTADSLSPGSNIIKAGSPVEAIFCIHCATTIAETNGRWLVPGKLERHPSAFELCVEQDEPVIIQDINNPNTS